MDPLTSMLTWMTDSPIDVRKINFVGVAVRGGGSRGGLSDRVLNGAVSFCGRECPFSITSRVCVCVHVDLSDVL